MKHVDLAVLPSLRLSARPLVLAILTLLGLVVAQASWNSYRTAREDALRAEVEALRFARETAHHQRAVMDQTFHLLRVLDGISLPESRAPGTCDRFLARQLERFPEYENLAFLRPNEPHNETIACSGRASPLPVAATDVGTSALPGKPLLLAFEPGHVTAMLRPGTSDHEGDMAIAGVMPLREFLLDTTSPARRDAAFAVMDSNGRLLATYPTGSDWPDATPDLTRALLGLDVGATARVTDATGADHLYLAQPLPGTAQPLRLAIRLPADAAVNLSRQASVLVAALGLAAFTFWLLLRSIALRAAEAFKRVDWSRISPPASWLASWQTISTRFRKPAQPRKPRRGPGETTILRVAYEDLKRAFADKEERMQQIMLLDELSRSSQGCHDLHELAQAIARCATALFPGSSGALLQRGANHQLATVLTWGPSSPMGTISLPLIVNNESMGILNLSGIDHYDPWAATSLAERAAAGMVAVKRQEQLRNRAMRDPLTGLYNRRFMEEALDIEQRRALRRGISIGMLILDIDHFKRFNDTYGHDAGDLLLRGMGALLRRAVREGDMPCRYGGEEFVVILPGADLTGTRQRAEALRAAIAQWDPQRDGQSLGPVTVSVGVAALPMHGTTWQKVLKAADQALYEAKHAGRNRVVSASAEPV